MANNKWPILRFHFNVRIDGSEISFHEVTGLEQEVEIVKYRFGSDKNFYLKKLPGLIQYPNLVCKKGVYKSDKNLSNLFKKLEESKVYYANGNTRKGFVITVVLLDAEANTIMTWELKDAFPVKYSSPELKADASEVAIEYMEFTYEKLEII